MEGNNWVEFERHKCKLKDKCNKLFIRWEKKLWKKKKRTNKLKAIKNELNKIKECIEKIK